MARSCWEVLQINVAFSLRKRYKMAVSNRMSSYSLFTVKLLRNVHSIIEAGKGMHVSHLSSRIVGTGMVQKGSTVYVEILEHLPQSWNVLIYAIKDDVELPTVRIDISKS